MMIIMFSLTLYTQPHTKYIAQNTLSTVELILRFVLLFAYLLIVLYNFFPFFPLSKDCIEPCLLILYKKSG